MFQRVLDCIHQGGDILFEIGIEGLVHAAEQGSGHLRAAELAIFDGIHPGGHPAAADKCLVRFGLIAGGTLPRGIVQPDVRDMEAGEDTIWRGLPGDA